MLLEGKKGVILGVANQRSIAWGIAKALMSQGAKAVFAYQNERFKSNLEKILAEFGGAPMFECDVAVPSTMEALVRNTEAEFGKIDFLVHSLAYAKKENLESEFYNTDKDGYMLSMEISAYSLIALCRHFLPLFNEGASVMALSYLGSTKSVLNYNMMGVSKAALEACVRYLAMDFGPRGIRVNAISPGPIQTLAARGIKDFSFLHKIHPKIAMLRRTPTLEDVGGAGVFLASDLSSGITSEILFVDGGFRNVAIGDQGAYQF